MIFGFFDRVLVNKCDFLENSLMRFVKGDFIPIYKFHLESDNYKKEVIIMDMDFESKRKALLKDLSSMKRENAINRKLSAIKNLRHTQENISESGIPASHSKPAVAVYGKQSVFMRSFLQAVKNLCDLYYSEKNEELINECLEKAFSVVVIDMDEPTDWRMSTDIFSSVKTINPDQRFGLLTSKPGDPNVEVLLHKGAVLIRKPVNVSDFMDFAKMGKDYT